MFPQNFLVLQQGKCAKQETTRVKTWGHSTVRASPPSCPCDALTLRHKGVTGAGSSSREATEHVLLNSLRSKLSQQGRAQGKYFSLSQKPGGYGHQYHLEGAEQTQHLSLGVSTRVKNHWFWGQQLRGLTLFGLQNCSCLCRWNPCAHCHGCVEHSYFWKELSLF